LAFEHGGATGYSPRHRIGLIYSGINMQHFDAVAMRLSAHQLQGFKAL
jgi:hypothetical protein